MWSRSVPVGEIRPLGDHALLVGVRDAAAARALVGAIHATDRPGPPGIAEVVGGLATVMVSFDDAGHPDELRSWLRALVDQDDPTDALGTDGGEPAMLVTVPTVFDGPDIAEVAAMAGCAPGEVGALVSASTLTVAVVGFSPGFAYLEGLPDALSRIPRRPSPRPVVPAGSVALANGHAAVYPSASPGGWHLIGRTSETFFDPLVPPYARLAPGDRVRFIVAAAIDDPPPPAGHASPLEEAAEPVFVVEQPGLRTVRQDAGRRGLAAIGVPAAGPADPFAFALANRLVGNPAGAGTLEVTATGPTLRCLRPTFVAVVGARPDLHLQGQPVPAGRVVPVNVGQRLEVGAVRGGLHCYVAVAGGFTGPELLGSSACDLLAALGPGPLATGDRLGAGALTPPLGDHVREDALAELVAGETVTLRVVPGPHPERFTSDALASLARRRFMVQAASNRVGLRLRDETPPGASPSPLVAGGSTELDSQGTVTGVVQVPPDGHPVILLTDHATLGGYPVLAVVAAVDHGVLGQCAPGTTVVLEPITDAQSRQLLADRRRRLDGSVVGQYPLAVA